MLRSGLVRAHFFPSGRKVRGRPPSQRETAPKLILPLFSIPPEQCEKLEDRLFEASEDAVPPDQPATAFRIETAGDVETFRRKRMQRRTDRHQRLSQLFAVPGPSLIFVSRGNKNDVGKRKRELDHVRARHSRRRLDDERAAFHLLDLVPEQ